MEHSTSPERDHGQLSEQRALLRTRHAHAITTLMEARADLRGVNAWADFVDDAVRWSA
jgi:hypothetical protein